MSKRNKALHYITLLVNDKKLETLFIIDPTSLQVKHLLIEDLSKKELQNLILQTQGFLLSTWSKRKKLKKNAAKSGPGTENGDKSLRSQEPNTKGRQLNVKEMFKTMSEKKEVL